VSRRIAIASEDIDKSSANTFHVNSGGIFRAREDYEEFCGGRLESISQYGDVALFELSAGT
jgi:hypothetical protein